MWLYLQAHKAYFMFINCKAEEVLEKEGFARSYSFLELLLWKSIKGQQEMLHHSPSFAAQREQEVVAALLYDTPG